MKVNEAKKGIAQQFLDFAMNNEPFLNKWANILLNFGFITKSFNYKYFEEEFCTWIDSNFGAISPASEKKCLAAVFPELKKRAISTYFGEPENLIHNAEEWMKNTINPYAWSKDTTFWQTEVENDAYNLGWASVMYLKNHLEDSPYSTPPGSLGYLIGRCEWVKYAFNETKYDKDCINEWCKICFKTDAGQELINKMANAWLSNNPNSKRIQENKKSIKTINESQLRKIVAKSIRKVLNESGKTPSKGV